MLGRPLSRSLGSLNPRGFGFPREATIRRAVRKRLDAGTLRRDRALPGQSAFVKLQRPAHYVGY